MRLVLVLNLGSTTSKFALYEDRECVVNETIAHELTVTQLPLTEQAPKRQATIECRVQQAGYHFEDVDAIACRGGLVKPIEGGVYHVDAHLYNELKAFNYGIHASNLSGMMGYQLAQKFNIPVFTIDPPVTDELMPIARITGIKGIERISRFHALNQKGVARKYAAQVGKDYRDVNVIVAHMGGGITVGSHVHGKVIDVNEGLEGEGAFSPERAGSIPNDALYRYGYDHDMTPDEMDHFLSKKTGLLSLLGTNDLTQLSQQYGEDTQVTRILDAMAYQVAKLIGERAVAFKGAPVDQIILTGGIANSDVITEGIRQYVEWIAPVSVYAGEMEMEALASGVFDVLEGTVEPKYYQ